MGSDQREGGEEGKGRFWRMRMIKLCYVHEVWALELDCLSLNVSSFSTSHVNFVSHSLHLCIKIIPDLL